MHRDLEIMFMNVLQNSYKRPHIICTSVQTPIQFSLLHYLVGRIVRFEMDFKMVTRGAMPTVPLDYMKDRAEYTESNMA